MIALRGFLVTVFLVILGYTAVVGATHGWNLLPVFFGDIAAMTWPGQFNLDFLCFLLLTGVWLAWRHRFSTKGMILGVVGVFGGMLFLSGYLFLESLRPDADVKRLLLGPQADR